MEVRSLASSRHNAVRHLIQAGVGIAFSERARFDFGELPGFPTLRR
jgi:hypothetical protein